MTRWLLVVACALAACSRGGPAWPVPCTVTAECPSGYHCGVDQHCRSDVPCQLDDDCCLGERCVNRTCEARVNCSLKSPCPLPNQACASGLCVPKLCISQSHCPTGSQCVDGRCLDHVPCHGPCADDMACAPTVDRCVPLHAPHATCPAGSMRVLEDGERLAEGCQGKPETTHCLGLPPLAEGSYGTPAVTLALGATLAVLAYDTTYGDVVLARHDPSPPFARRDLRVLTGLPDAAPVVGDVGGPRGGIAAPGPDRGRVLAAAADSQGRLVAVLRDDTADSLRYLRLDSAGLHEHVLQALPGIGEALALRIDPQDRPAVLAFQPATTAHAGQLLLWRATTSQPASGNDWVLQALDTDPALAAGQPQAPLHTDPQGRGAWLDLARGEDGLWQAAAYSTLSQDLRIYHEQPGAGWSHTDVPRTAIPGGSADFGRFVSLQAQADGRALVACEDHAWGRLLLVREVADGFAVRVLDSGDRSDGHHRVGADSRLVRHTAGGLYVLHQDTRRGDLLAVHLSDPEAAPATTTLQDAAASGFSPSLCALGSKAWVAAGTTLRVQPDGAVTREVSLTGIIWQGE